MKELLSEEHWPLTRLGPMLRQHRGTLSLRQAALDAGVAVTTFTRAEKGAYPDLGTFKLLCDWLGVSPGQFFPPVAAKVPEPLDAAIAALRSDPRLNPINAARIIDTVKGMYAAFAKPLHDGEASAVSVRLPNILRPGVPEGLAELTAQIESQLAGLAAEGSR